MPQDLKPAAVYVRVSTDDQLEYSPDAQLVEVRKYATTHGYLIPNEFIFMDEGISGKGTKKRSEFNRMIGIAKQKPKPFDAILLWKFSRFARNRQDSIVYKSMLRHDLGIDVLSISEPLTDDKMSIIMEAMIEAMDEYYSINLAEEVKRGMTEKARRGELQATPSFGYSVEGGMLIPKPDEASIVGAIFQRFIEGEGLFPIAKWINSMGITTHRGNQFENRTVEYILRNPVYIGKLRWNPSGRTHRDFTNENIILADAKHQAIIAQETWDTAQLRMAAVKAQWKYHGRPLSEHRDWLSGLIRCADCNCTLILAGQRYWKCNGYVRGSCRTTQHTPDKRLKGMVLACMEHDQQADTPINYVIAHAKPEQIDELSRLQDQQKQLSTKLSRLRDAYLAGIETLDSYGQAKTVLEAQTTALTERITNTQKPKVEAADACIKESIRCCALILSDPTIDLPTKQRSAHQTIEKCIYNKSTNSIKVFYRLTLSQW